MIPEKILFIGDTSRWSVQASDYLRSVFHDVDSIFWDHGDDKPNLLKTWTGDRIFCFKADLILDPHILGRVRKTAINFHPSIPRFRGIGGYDYILHEGGREFGVTCHHIVSKIDSGRIIKVQRFPVIPGEGVACLRERTAAYCLLLFYEIIHAIRTGVELPESDEKWDQTLYTRAMLEAFYQARFTSNAGVIRKSA